MMPVRMEDLRRADERLSRHAGVIGAALAVLIGAGFALRNVAGGPLYNLNDIGGWRSRFVFLLMAGAALGALELLCVRLRPASFWRMALRQALLAVAFSMSMLAVNQKTFFYTEQAQPVLRALQEGGLRAWSGESALSAPMQTLLMLLSRLPVYDMYTAKLLAVACFEALALLSVRAAEPSLPGLRAEALLLLSLILPQAFLSAACAAQPDMAALLALALALRLVRRRPAAAAALFGLSVALCGVLLLAAPLFMPLLPEEAATGREARGKALLRAAAFALAGFLLPMLPAVLSGVPAGAALASPFRALLGAPPYASGSPNLMALFPRAAAMEMPEAFLLRRVPALDLVTNDSPFYTQRHFELLMRGLSFAGIAAFLGASAYLGRRLTGARRTLALSAAALFAAPGGSMALWTGCCLLCLRLMLTDREMRVPCAALLFATAAGCAYPVTGEILIRPAYTAMLTLAAILAASGVLVSPSRRGEGSGTDGRRTDG